MDLHGYEVLEIACVCKRLQVAAVVEHGDAGVKRVARHDYNPSAATNAVPVTPPFHGTRLLGACDFRQRRPGMDSRTSERPSDESNSIHLRAEKCKCVYCLLQPAYPRTMQ